MRIPKLQEISFSPLMWKECIVKSSDFKTLNDFYSYFYECVKEQNWLKDVKVKIIYVPNKRIKRLVNGYLLFDILKWYGRIKLVKVPMWRLFEDLVGEIFREALRERSECSVVHVDGLGDFKGLDYVVMNTEKGGWNVGIQCKEYIGSSLPKCKLKESESRSRNISAPYLEKKGKELHKRFPNKKFVLVAFNAFRTNKLEERRFSSLKNAWDCVMVFDKSIDNKVPYTYRIDLRELNKIIKWC